MKPSRFKVILTSVALGAGLLTPLAPAEAAVNDPGCRNNSVCVWDYRAFDNRGHHEVHGFRTPYVGNALNDRISSYRIGYSTTQYKYVRFYDHAYNPADSTGSGPSFYDRHNHGMVNLLGVNHPKGGNWEDKISSYDEAA